MDLSETLITREDIQIIYGPALVRTAEQEIAKLENPTEKLAKAYEIFGRRGSEILPLLNPKP